MSGSSFAQGFPQMPTVFVDPATGRLTPVAYRLLLSMWNRTGGANGTSTTTLSGLLALTDVPDAPDGNAFGMSLGPFSDAAEAALGPNPFMAAMAAANDSPQAPQAQAGMWALASTIEG